MKFASYPRHTQLVFLTFFLWFIKPVDWPSWSVSLFSVLLQQQVPCVCHWEHTGLMVGWQSYFIMCALNTRDSTMWNTDTPHPCTKPGWIFLLKHQLITFGHCNKRHLWPYAAVEFSPWPVTVLRTISRVAVKVCPHRKGSRKRSVVHCLAKPWEVDKCLTLKKGVLPETSVLNKMTGLQHGLGHFIMQKCPKYPDICEMMIF